MRFLVKENWFDFCRSAEADGGLAQRGDYLAFALRSPFALEASSIISINSGAW